MSASQARGFETRPDLVADGFKLELFSGMTYSTVQSKSSVSCFPVFEKKFLRSLLGSRTWGCDGSPIGLSRVTEKNPNWLGPVSRCVGKVCCIFRPAFGSLSAFKLWIKYSTSVLVQTLKKHYFAKFCTKFVAFLPFQLFSASLHKKCWKWLFWPAFGVRSNQTLVKINNKGVGKSQSQPKIRKGVASKFSPLIHPPPCYRATGLVLANR